MRATLSFAVPALSLALTVGAEPIQSITLVVRVLGIESAKGVVVAALYCSKNDWLQAGKWYAATNVPPKNGTTISFANVTEDRCAVSVFQDENSSGSLDIGLFGPKEPYGFSRNPKPKIGPPSFDDCAIEITSNFEVDIFLR